MRDEQQHAHPEVTGAVQSLGAPSALDADRTFLLECRLEQLRSAAVEARAEADRARSRLAEVAAREADHAQREALLRIELAAAREDVASLHRRLEQSEALRAELDGHLFEADAEGLVRLRRELLAERQRAAVDERTLAHLRARVEDLVASRETLLTRVVEWQRLVRGGDTDAVDLAEFIAGLRGDILELEHLNAMGERREAELREQLQRAGAGAKMGPVARPAAPFRDASRGRGAEVHHEAPPEPLGPADPATLPASPSPVATERAIVGGMDDMSESAETGDAASAEAGRESTAVPGEGDRTVGLLAALAATESPDMQVALLLRIGRSGEEGAVHAIGRWVAATEPRVRAASYEALGRLLEHDPSLLEPHLRVGLADSDPRVRRRVVLAATTARGLDLRTLLEPLRADADPQVRRVVQQVLRRAEDIASGQRDVSASAFAGAARSSRVLP